MCKRVLKHECFSLSLSNIERFARSFAERDKPSHACVAQSSLLIRSRLHDITDRNWKDEMFCSTPHVRGMLRPIEIMTFRLMKGWGGSYALCERVYQQELAVDPMLDSMKVEMGSPKRLSNT